MHTGAVPSNVTTKLINRYKIQPYMLFIIFHTFVKRPLFYIQMCEPFSWIVKHCHYQICQNAHSHVSRKKQIMQIHNCKLMWGSMVLQELLIDCIHPVIWFTINQRELITPSLDYSSYLHGRVVYTSGSQTRGSPLGVTKNLRVVTKLTLV